MGVCRGQGKLRHTTIVESKFSGKASKRFFDIQDFQVDILE